MDGRTCDSKTALCTVVHRAVKALKNKIKVDRHYGKVKTSITSIFARGDTAMPDRLHSSYSSLEATYLTTAITTRCDTKIMQVNFQLNVRPSVCL